MAGRGGRGRAAVVSVDQAHGGVRARDGVEVSCHDGNRGAYWLGIIGFALAGPAATEAAAQRILTERDAPDDRAIDVSFDFWDGMTVAWHRARGDL